MSWLLLLVIATPALAQNADSELVMVATSNPKMLDTSEYYSEPNTGFPKFFKGFLGEQVVDGLPFTIEGSVTLYGKTTASRGHTNIDAMRGIEVGRKMDELHLIHHTFWPDVDDEVVAYVWLNYADGSKYAMPLRYGVHLRDWYNVPSFEKERVTDPNTSICWRRAAVQFKAPVRLYKTRLSNPLPEKVVESIDFVSARNLSTYSLIAATVSDSVTINYGDIVTDRHFDAAIKVNIVDDATGKPIDKALVQISTLVQGEFVVGTPFYTSAKGTGEIRYPTEHTARIIASVTKQGYQSSSQSWRTTMPPTATFRLSPVKR